MTNFIETYKTDKSLCDDLIKFYHINKHKHLEGTVGDKVSHNKKQSTELIMPPEEFFKLPEGQRYIKELQKCYFKYREKYPYVDKTYGFNVNQNIKYNSINQDKDLQCIILKMMVGQMSEVDI